MEFSNGMDTAEQPCIIGEQRPVFAIQNTSTFVGRFFGQQRHFLQNDFIKPVK